MKLISVYQDGSHIGGCSVWYEEIEDREFTKEKMLKRFREARKANNYARMKGKKLGVKVYEWPEKEAYKITPSNNYY